MKYITVALSHDDTGWDAISMEALFATGYSLLLGLPPLIR